MTKRHHPKSREERLEIKKKLEEKEFKPTKPRSIRGKIKDAIKSEETQDELRSYVSS